MIKCVHPVVLLNINDSHNRCYHVVNVLNAISMDSILVISDAVQSPEDTFNNSLFWLDMIVLVPSKEYEVFVVNLYYPTIQLIQNIHQ